MVFPCKFKQENQYFRYDPETKQIFCGRMRDNICIDSDPSKDKVFYTNCDATKATQKWTFGTVNMTMLSDWANFGKPILDPLERRDFGLENGEEVVQVEEEVDNAENVEEKEEEMK